MPGQDSLAVEARGPHAFWSAGSAPRVGVTQTRLRWPHGTVHAARRCVSLRIRAVEELAGCDPPECLVLLTELHERLTEIEEKLTAWGCKEKCVDIKLERAEIKR